MLHPPVDGVVLLEDIDRVVRVASLRLSHHENENTHFSAFWPSPTHTLSSCDRMLTPADKAVSHTHFPSTSL